jgi:hypothetical protein
MRVGGDVYSPAAASGTTTSCQRPATAARHRACADLIAAYDGDTHQLLRDMADRLEASLAYVDRPMVDAHLKRARALHVFRDSCRSSRGQPVAISCCAPSCALRTGTTH